MKALIVIDMQEEYVGQKRNKKRYPYDSEQLIKNINSRIATYEQRTKKALSVRASIFRVCRGLGCPQQAIFHGGPAGRAWKIRKCQYTSYACQVPHFLKTTY